jgi:hypothetical protein
MYSGLYDPAETALNKAISLQPDMSQALLYRTYLNLRMMHELEQAVVDGLALKVGNETSASESSSSVPEPTDISLKLNYNFSASKLILPDLVQLIQGIRLNELQSISAGEKAIALARPDARSGVERSVKLQREADRKQTVAKFRSAFIALRTRHVEDAEARKELSDVMTNINEHMNAAIADINAVVIRQPQFESATKHVLSQIKKKQELLSGAERLISASMKKEDALRSRLLSLAEEFLTDCPDDFEKEASLLTEKLVRADSTAEINQALLVLQDSINVQVDVENGC